MHFGTQWLSFGCHEAGLKTGFWREENTRKPHFPLVADPVSGYNNLVAAIKPRRQRS
jgi:hypothetical protein